MKGSQRPACCHPGLWPVSLHCVVSAMVATDFCHCWSCRGCYDCFKLDAMCYSETAPHHYAAWLAPLRAPHCNLQFLDANSCNFCTTSLLLSSTALHHLSRSGASSLYAGVLPADVVHALCLMHIKPFSTTCTSVHGLQARHALHALPVLHFLQLPSSTPCI